MSADLQAFAHHDDRPARAAQQAVDVVGHLLERDGPLGQVDLQRHLAMRVGEAGRRGDKADFAAHRLQDEDRVGRAAAGVLFVGKLHRVRPVAGRAAVAGRVVDELERAVADVVVDRLGDADADEVQAPLVGEFGDLVGRVHRVVAADVAEIADVVGLEDFDQAVEVLLLRFAELVAAGADRAGRRRHPQQGDFVGGLAGEVEQFFLEHAFDAVPAGVDRADLRKAAGRLDQPAEAVVDHGRRAARLGDDHVASFGHAQRLRQAFSRKADILQKLPTLLKHRPRRPAHHERGLARGAGLLANAFPQKNCTRLSLWTKEFFQKLKTI